MRYQFKLISTARADNHVDLMRQLDSAGAEGFRVVHSLTFLKPEISRPECFPEVAFYMEREINDNVEHHLNVSEIDEVIGDLRILITDAMSTPNAKLYRLDIIQRLVEEASVDQDELTRLKTIVDGLPVEFEPEYDKDGNPEDG